MSGFELEAAMKKLPKLRSHAARLTGVSHIRKRERTKTVIACALMGPDEYAQTLGAYEVREGRDGKWGIYTRKFDVRLATFARNSFALRAALRRLFDEKNK